MNLVLKLLFVFLVGSSIVVSQSGSAAPSDTDVTTLDSFQEIVESAYLGRAQLLENALGACQMEFTKVAPSAQYALQHPHDAWTAQVGKWTTNWYQKHESYRYDVVHEVSESESAIFRIPYDMRVAADNDSCVFYSAPSNSAYLSGPIRRRGNLFGFSRAFRIDYCYDAQINGLDYPMFMKSVLEASDGSDIALAEEVLDGISCQKFSYSGVPTDSGATEQVTMWFAPAQNYSLIKLEHFSNWETLHSDNPEMKKIFSYEGEYERAVDSSEVWVLKHLRMEESSRGVGREVLVIAFERIELDARIPDEVFTFEGLDVPPGALVVDRRESDSNPSVKYYRDYPRQQLDDMASQLVNSASSDTKGVKPPSETGSGGNKPHETRNSQAVPDNVQRGQRYGFCLIAGLLAGAVSVIAGAIMATRSRKHRCRGE